MNNAMRWAEGGHCPDARAVPRTRCPGWGWQTCATLSRQCLLEQVSRPFYTFRELKTCILVLVWNFARVCVAGCCPYIYIQRQGEAMYILLSWPPSLCPSFSINLQEYKDVCFPNWMSLQMLASCQCHSAFTLTGRGQQVGIFPDEHLYNVPMCIRVTITRWK